MYILGKGDKSGERGGAGNADMSEKLHQDENKQNVGSENDNAVFDRSFGISAGKKVRRQGFDHNIYRQADRIGDDGGRSLKRILCIKPAMLK